MRLAYLLNFALRSASSRLFLLIKYGFWNHCNGCVQDPVQNEFPSLANLGISLGSNGLISCVGRTQIEHQHLPLDESATSCQCQLLGK